MTEESLADLLPEEAQQPPAPQTDEPLPVDTATPDAKQIPTKAELEITVSELREALNESRVRENSLHQQIADLQSDLQEQKILLQKLLSELESTNKIKAELEQAKKVILQLLDDKSKTTQEANTPKKENKDLRSQKLALKKLPNHSIKPDSPSGETFERNVGWFD